MDENDVVLPSSLLDFADDNYYGAFNKTFNNFSLKVGIVKKVHEIEDERNLNKQIPEYDILTFEQDQNKGITPITYRNCINLDSFGGIADFFEFKKTEPDNSPDLKELKDDDGSYVLVLCLDGSNTKGVILGAIPHHNRKKFLNKQNERHLEGEFNGLRVKVNKDGELTITFKGATDKKGKPKDTKGGSQIRMEKDGSIEINDRDLEGELKSNFKDDSDFTTPSDDYDKIRIDKTNQSIDIITRKDQNYKAKGNWNQEITGNTTHKTTDLILTAQGRVNYQVSNSFEIKTNSLFKVKSTSSIFESDIHQIRSSSVRVHSPTIALGYNVAPSLIFQTQYIGIGNLGAPVISISIGPFSNTVFIE